MIPEQVLREELDTLARRLRELGSRLGGSGSCSEESRLDRVWRTAPLRTRIAFTRDLLESEHPFQGTLHEAGDLVRVWEGGRLEQWLRSYPSLFVDAFLALESVAAEDAVSDAEALAARVLNETGQLLHEALAGLGVEWILPRPGDPPGDEHEVIGVATEPGLRAGVVARCHRRGLRWKGRVHLPAQVLRQQEDTRPLAGQSTETRAAVDPSPAPKPEREQSAEPQASPHPPSWLAGLTFSPAVQEGLVELWAAAAAGRDLDDRELVRRLTPLLSSLGPGGALRIDPGIAGDDETGMRASLAGAISWLADALRVEFLAPPLRSPFRASEMEIAAERRSAHPQEWETVARLELAGIRRAGRVLLPARVVRYSPEGIA